MKINPQALLAGSILSFGVFTAVADARADTKQECADAYEKTQSLRERGHLTDARNQAAACSASTCSVYVVNDCKQWLAEINESLPTVVLALENATGVDLRAVSVTVDGHPVAEALNGEPIPLDPGEHVVRFEIIGAEAVEQKVTLQAGEKNRALTASLKQAPPSTPPAPLPASLPPEALPPPEFTAPKLATTSMPTPERKSDGRGPLWAWTAGSVGVVALGLSAGFGVSALNAQSKLVTACGGDPAHCSKSTQAVTVPLADQGTHDRNLSIGLGATALLGIGVAVVGIVTAPSSTSSPRTSLFLAPFGSPSSGGMEMRGQF